jgi:hypothetical protein
VTERNRTFSKLKKNVFLKNEGQKGKVSPTRGWYQWEKEGHKERVKEGKYGGNTMYSCMKMEQ